MRERQLLGDCYVKLQEYEKAQDAYRMALGEMEDQTAENVNLFVRCYAGYALCDYEVGNYEAAIELGNAALEMNRHIPGRYIPVAKSYKAIGKMEDAIRTLKTAAFYGKGWDADAYATVCTLLDEWQPVPTSAHDSSCEHRESPHNNSPPPS